MLKFITLTERIGEASKTNTCVFVRWDSVAADAVECDISHGEIELLT